MKIFKINEDMNIVCEAKKTRSGFRHEATLLQCGNAIQKVKCCYINRTWERYEYETVVRKMLGKIKILNKNLNEKEITDILNNFGDISLAEVNAHFKTIGMIAELGNFFGKNIQEKNDWKIKMIRAGLEKEGLIMPDDWYTLSENDKEIRVNNIIEQLVSSK